MTENKPIIIDGVDVSECFHCGSQNNCMIYGNEKCDRFPNCYFRQLARKMQECEELKSARDNWLSKCEQETKIKEFYQDELDQLRAENETYKQMLDNPEVRVALTDIRSGERDLWQKYKSRMEQAAQKLKQIRELATALYYKVMSDGVVILQEDILQIIDEVE